MHDNDKKQLIQLFNQAKQKIILLDYDGTLVPIMKHHSLAKPTKDLLSLLTNLANTPNTDLVIISGRDKSTLQKWLAIKNINIIAEHGAWIKTANTEWQTIKPLINDWKPQIIDILQKHSDKSLGTFVEEKECSVCWHYRNLDEKLAPQQTKELIKELTKVTGDAKLQILPGKKVIEIRDSGIHKGIGSKYFISQKKYDFVLAIGDDMTDEDMFRVLPPGSHIIKVGMDETCANYRLANNDEVLQLLQQICIFSQD